MFLELSCFQFQITCIVITHFPDFVFHSSSEQAEQYEHKLIQVAEMHGELMEFNDYLTRQLKAKDSLIKVLRDELVDLRGPLPEDRSDSELNSPDSET